jgi:hypothetical protein
MKQAAVSAVDFDMLQRTWMQPECHLSIARVINGGHVESLSVFSYMCSLQVKL